MQQATQRCSLTKSRTRNGASSGPLDAAMDAQQFRFTRLQCQHMSVAGGGSNECIAHSSHRCTSTHCSAASPLLQSCDTYPPDATHMPRRCFASLTHLCPSCARCQLGSNFATAAAALQASCNAMQRATHSQKDWSTRPLLDVNGATAHWQGA